MIKRRFLLFLLAMCPLLNTAAQTSTVYPKKKHAKRIVCYNVRHCAGMDEKINYHRICDVIRQTNADFVCLQELDSATSRSAFGYQIDTLAKQLKMNGYFSSAIHYQGGTYGLGLLSKETPLHLYKVALPGVEPRTCLIAEYKKYVIASLHLDLKEEYRIQSVDTITNLIIKIGKTAFLAGDFNENNLQGDVFAKLTGHWKIISSSEQTFSTIALNKRIDFILQYIPPKQKAFTCLQAQTVYALPDVMVKQASDHYPLFIDFK